MKPRGIGSALAIAAKVLPLCAAIGVPFFFVYSTWIAAHLEKALRLEVEPSFTGGRLLAEFPNPIGGDTGQGSYTYPLGQGWEKGELNLVRYAVRAPVPRPVWGFSGAYWQLEASFAKAVPTGLSGGGFRAPVLHVYIQIPDAAGARGGAAREGAVGGAVGRAVGGAVAKPSGSTESAFGEGELLRFDPAHPWDYAVSADGWSPSGEIRSADGSYRAQVATMWDFAHRRLILRIGLEKTPPLLASVIAGGPSWHYVLVGAYDPAREGHFAAVRDEANLHDGGGAKDELSPRVFDLIAPRGTSKASELSSEDQASGSYALVSPVEAGGPAARASDPALRGRLEEAAAKEAAASGAERASRLAALPPRSPADSGLIGELFQLGLETRCLEAIKADLAARPGDSVALAYRGAIVARSAEKAAGLGEKMRLVAEAYRDLDAAVEGSAASARAEDRIAILVCRGSVSSAVPNDVFGRAAQGAADLDAAADLAAGAGDPTFSRSCLADAALAYEKAGLPEDAESRWATLAATKGLPSAIRLQLIDRGYETEE